MPLTSLKYSVAAALALILSQGASARDLDFDFADATFTTPLTIDNQYLPLPEGATFIYKAEGPDGCEIDVVNVLAPGDPNGFKQITVGGTTIQVRVIEDLAYEDEECDGADPEDLVEKTYDWHAQDDADNVWYLGEETYDCNGALSCALGDGSWEAGEDVAGVGHIAAPGIVMLANPRSGDSYYQEFYEGFAEDQASIMTTGYTAKLKREDAIEPGTFNDCIVTKEWNKLEAGHVEQKTYCPEVGLVMVEEHHGKKLTFELTEPGAGSDSSDAFTFRKPPRN